MSLLDFVQQDHGVRAFAQAARQFSIGIRTDITLG